MGAECERGRVISLLLKLWMGTQEVNTQFPTLPQTPSVPLGKSHNLSMLQVPIFCFYTATVWYIYLHCRLFRVWAASCYASVRCRSWLGMLGATVIQIIKWKWWFYGAIIDSQCCVQEYHHPAMPDQVGFTTILPLPKKGGLFETVLSNKIGYGCHPNLLPPGQVNPRSCVELHWSHQDSRWVWKHGSKYRIPNLASTLFVYRVKQIIDFLTLWQFFLKSEKKLAWIQ